MGRPQPFTRGTDGEEGGGKPPSLDGGLLQRLLQLRFELSLERVQQRLRGLASVDHLLIHNAEGVVELQ